MKKTLIAAGIAAVVAAPAAFADVSVSGVVEQAFTDTDGASGEWAGSSDNSLTFKASEDLGNGLTAFAAITLDVDNQTTATGATDATTYTHNTTKDQIVGLKGSFGTVLAGRFEPFTEGKLMSRLTLEGDGSAGGGALEGGSNVGRTNSGIAYVSPTMNGFHVGVGGYAVANATNGADKSAFDATDIAVFYDNGPLSIAASHQVLDYSGTNEDQKATVITASYSMGDAKFTVLKASTDSVAGTAADDRDDMGYRLDYKMGNNSITVSMLDDEGANGADAGKKWGVELAHNFSKRTKAYINMVDMDTTDSGSEDTMTFGLKHKF